MKMKGYAMLGIGKTGWIEKEVPACGPLDAIVKPVAVSPCTSDVHTVWEGAIGDRRDMILGHEAVGEIVEVGSLVKDLKVGERSSFPPLPPIGAASNRKGDIPCTRAACWRAGSSLTSRTAYSRNFST